MDARRSIAVLDAPSNLGLRPPSPGTEPGVKHLPDALRDTGIVSRLAAQDAGTVPAPPYSADRDAATRVRNAQAIAKYSVDLANRIETLLNEGTFPLVLGGDCSILLGSMLSLKRWGRYGLAYIDGHLDFRHPGHGEEVGAAAGEVLALLTGRGAPLLTNIEGRGPLVREEDIVAIGHREYEAREFDVANTRITRISANEVKRVGAVCAAQSAVASLEREDLDGFWMQIDADVLDASMMPAVDSPDPGGLNYQELEEILRVFAASSTVTGAVITIFDPTLDQDGSLAQAFATTIVNGFTPER